MRVLLDECVPRKLRREITAGSTRTVQEMGWGGIKNGELLRRAETQFDVLLTTDQNIEYQQNIKSLGIAIIVIIAPQNDIDFLRPIMPQVQRALEAIKPAEVKRINVIQDFDLKRVKRRKQNVFSARKSIDISSTLTEILAENIPLARAINTEKAR